MNKFIWNGMYEEVFYLENMIMAIELSKQGMS